jgi:endonuclease/exonuclease/phosphatase family metal-dependent hydrolase
VTSWPLLRRTSLTTLPWYLQIVLLGDLNEVDEAQPITTLERYMTQLEAEKPEERYSYTFDAVSAQSIPICRLWHHALILCTLCGLFQNCQQIDHVFTTKKLAKTAQFEALHVNTWGLLNEQASDHDPLLASIRVC